VTRAAALDALARPLGRTSDAVIRLATADDFPPIVVTTALLACLQATTVRTPLPMRMQRHPACACHRGRRCTRRERTLDHRSAASIKARACCAASLRGCNELRSRNENASFRISALHAALSTSREVYSVIFCNRKTIIAQIPAMTPVLSKTENGKSHAQ
jgi:hypothetical protein